MIKEFIGYIGMFFVVSSFLFKDINWVRRINIIGAIISAIYGAITATYATMVLNILLFIINLSMLVKMRVEKRNN